MNDQATIPRTEYASSERATFEEFKSAQGEMRQNASLLAALEAIPGYALLLNEHRQVLLANSRFLRTFGFTDALLPSGLRPGELTGCPKAELGSGGCGTSKSCVGCSVVNSILWGLEKLETAESKGSLTTKFGEIFVEAIASPLIFDGKRYITLSIRDITEKQRLQEMREKMDAQIENTARLSALGTLVAGVAHEINNPLAIVLASIENLQMSISDVEPQIAKALARARKSAERIAAIVSRMRELNVHDSTDAAPFTLVDAVEKALNLTEVPITKAEIEIKKDLPSNPAFAVGSPTRFQQALCAILLNSHDALTNREPPRTIEIELKETPEGSLLRISDNGWGIEEEHLPKIFNPFFTTKEPGHGIGLGLTSAHKTITAMGGTIAVNSEIEKGTTVCIALPKPKSAT